MSEDERYEAGFDAGLKFVLDLLDKQGGPRDGIEEAVLGVKDNFDKCSHGRFRYEPCFDCLRIAIIAVLKREHDPD
ncbi:hypothetical protein [Rhizobium mayense]|uniref:Uncharacterized protein n=1 Tax=Rhizobium mayense TaxID=1312184 RepID=A0ABT7JUQ6_9HYPH|nr:hypothetical protein [Rhizobium mayense]MDL2399632.1 hypothetical protein [Rhizobium mayense]